MSCSRYIFLFTLGPVQSFIAQARKTADFYAGSRMLSDLVDTAIKVFQTHTGKVIFPNPENKAKPNRFLGIIENHTDLRKLGQDIEHAVREKFRIMAEKALENAKITQKPAGFDGQIENQLEIFWLFEPVEGDNFRQAYQNIEKNMGGIKNVRPFKQIFERGRKCSVDGEKNALFYRKKENRQFPAHLNRDAVEVQNISDVLFAKGEALSAVSLVKRFYYRDISFPSTAGIATLNAAQQLNELPEFNTYKSLFGGEWDERFLYEENLTEKEIPQDKLNEAKKQYAELSKALSKNNIKLYKYYALLVFDGDRMGKILSGAYLDTSRNLQEYQKHLSQLLGNYAKRATDIVKSAGYGQAIYAGGDDFVGFINLEHLFEALKTLRKSFETEVNQALQKQYPLVEDNRPVNFTFSAGVCIAHYKTPLGVVIKTAKKMEDKAKNEGNRNALGIAVLKRSGEQHETVLKWEKDTGNITRMQEITQALQNDFSDTWIKNTEQEFALMTDQNNEIQSNILEIFKYELKRLLGRSSLGCNKNDKNKVNNLYDELYLLFCSLGYDFEKFIQMLHICQFINRKTK
ncbi:MAG: type III-B CRISPR-associated protein Cas10/Cmr2 [Bacteroidia bacterium]|nr:type III-B CRISPR-associated protein Cas10/Cmr2 [Bacteroidia bacterium]